MNSLLWKAYDLVLSPLLIALFHVAALGNDKIREGLRLRSPDATGTTPWTRGPAGTRPIWIHCASGEFEYAKPVIQELKQREPQQKILVTYFSPSARIAIEKFPGVDFHSPAPWDLSRHVSALIQHHKPRALLIARTDAWPAMVHEAARLQVPTLLFSATLAENAGRLQPIARPFSRWVLKELNQIYCVSESDRASFEILGLGDKVTVSGDTRFDQVIARLRSPKPVMSLFAGFHGARVLIAGSTWEEDEVQLVPVLARMKNKMKFIVAPHEPSQSHIMALEARLAAAGLKHQRYSEAKKLKVETDVVVVDQVGILAELYAQGEFAFVGGSFRKTVHSVMEPLGAGCLTFVGPFHRNNREAIQFANIPLPGAEGHTAVTTVNDTDDWVAKLEDALASPPTWQPQIKRLIEERAGRSILIADWVFAHRL